MSVEILPRSASVLTGDTLRFSVRVTLSDHTNPPSPTVTITPTGGSLSGLLWTAPASAGFYKIAAAIPGTLVSDTATLVVSPPPAPGDLVTEPMPVTGDSILYNEDFESYASTATMVAATATKQTLGTLNLDQVDRRSGSKSLRIDWQTSATCTDADVLREKGLTGAIDRDTVIVQYWVKYAVGYQFNNPRCSAYAVKEFMLWRGPTPVERLAVQISDEPTVWLDSSAIETRVSTGPLNNYAMLFAGTATGVAANVAGSSYKIILKAQSFYSTKGPDALRDDIWHRYTFRAVRESAQARGDGLAQLWVDGFRVLHYNGKDPSDVMYRRVYTKRGPWTFLQYQTVFNRAAPVPQSRWYDDIRVWTR